MRNSKFLFTNTHKQIDILINILSKNKDFIDCLSYLEEIKIPNAYIGGASISQIAWNYFHGFDLNNGISDFDIVYYDKTDLSPKTEEDISKGICDKFPDCKISFDVVNEARTHLWYEKSFKRKIPQYLCTEEAIYTFPATAAAIGVNIKNKKLNIYAPHGLSDLLGMIVRANKAEIKRDGYIVHIPREVYEKKAKKWKSIWPKLTIVPWDYE